MYQTYILVITLSSHTSSHCSPPPSSSPSPVVRTRPPPPPLRYAPGPPHSPCGMHPAPSPPHHLPPLSPLPHPLQVAREAEKQAAEVVRQKQQRFALVEAHWALQLEEEAAVRNKVSTEKMHTHTHTHARMHMRTRALTHTRTLGSAHMHTWLRTHAHLAPHTCCGP